MEKDRDILRRALKNANELEDLWQKEMASITVGTDGLTVKQLIEEWKKMGEEEGA